MTCRTPRRPRTAPWGWGGVAVLATLCAACGGGGGGGAPGAAAPPVVLAVSAPLNPAAPQPFTVSGTGFPGLAGSDLSIRLKATDGLPLASCGSDELLVPATLTSASSVGATLPTFALTRTVTASVTLLFGGGASATSATPIATLVGTLDAGQDQDLDGLPDPCDPKTYTFEGDALGGRPAGTTPLDGPGQPALTVLDRAGDHAAAFTGSGSPIAYERFDRGAADVPSQDVTVYADLDPTGGSMNLELGNEGSFAGSAGASLIWQVQPGHAMVCYERQANQILRSLAGPALPAGGRVRLRLRKGEGTASTLHVDGLVGAAWQDDLLLFPVADDRPYRGLEVAASNYYGGARAIRRLTIVRTLPPGAFTLAKAPGRSMDQQVFQRGAGGTAAIPLRLLYRLPAGGSAAVRVVRSATGEVLAGFDFGDHAWALAGADPGRADLLLGGVPAGGNYDVQVRVSDASGALRGQQALLDVGVGDVYVAAGQSNMSGYSGNLLGVEAASPLAHLFHNDGTWKAAREPMDDGDAQTDWVSREFPASSCLLSFANELSLRTGIPVGVVPTSLGGTNLYAQWQRPEPFHAWRATLYGSMVARARLACPTTPPRGLLWFQGESDALANRTTAQYVADLQRLVAQAREDLAAPGLVFLCGQLGTYDGANQPFWVGVQEAQRQLVAADPSAALATACDLPRADSIHFNVAGYRTLGVRFARGARQRVFGQAADPTDDLVSVALGAGSTSAVLTYERAVSGGSAALFRAADGSGALTVSGVLVSGSSVTVTFARAVGTGGRLAYGYSNVPTEAWIVDALDASPVPLFDALVLTP